MTAVYSLEKEEREGIDKIFENVPQLIIAEKLREKMREFADTVVDEITDYMKDEYVLRFEEIALSQANHIVEALLKGDETTLESLGLKTRISSWGADKGKEVSYDSKNIRRRIVEHNIENIRNAEMVSLKEENARLTEQLEWARKSRVY